MRWVNKIDWNLVFKVSLALMLIYVVFFKDVSRPQEPSVPVVPVTETTPQEIRQQIPELSKSEARELSEKIVETRAEVVPEYHYYTVDHAQADEKAAQIAKQDKADKIIKTTAEIPVAGQPEGKKPVQVIENNYYGVTLEKKHELKLGAAYVDRDAYATLSYRNRDLEYTAMYNPTHGKWGAMVQYTVARW